MKTGPTLPATWCISMSFIIGLTRPSDSASELLGEGVTWMGALAAQGCECGGQGQSSESTDDEIQPTTHRLQYFLLCPTPALVQNMKLESSVAPHSLVLGSWSCTPCGNLHEWYKNNRNNENLSCRGGVPLSILPSSAAFEFPSKCLNTFLLLSLSGSVLHSSFVNSSLQNQSKTATVKY